MGNGITCTMTGSDIWSFIISMCVRTRRNTGASGDLRWKGERRRNVNQG
jgi:hypothetical protein